MFFSNKHIKTEQGAFDNLIHQYNDKVFSYISKKIQKKEDAEDVLQNVFLHLWISRKSLHPTNTPNIVFTTCNDKIAEFYRISKKRPAIENKAFNHADNSSEELESVEIKEQLLIELEKNVSRIIPPLRRKIFSMNKLEGITQEQIATELNVPKSTVKYHISEAMLFLKDHQ